MVSFSYFTREAIADTTRTSIRREAEALNRSRAWTSTDSLIFLEMEGFESRAFGNSKFFPDGLGNEGKDISDVQFIVNTLSDWSRRFHVTWQITAQEDHVGIIADGEADDNVYGFVESLSDAELW